MSMSIESVIEAYIDYLSHNYPKQLSAFDGRFRSDHEAAVTEAVVFRFLREISRNPHVFEDSSTGGPDFECTIGGRPCLVEATCLRVTSVEKASGISDNFRQGAQAFAPLTTRVFRKVLEKGARRQLDGFTVPRILCIASSHTHAPLLFSRHAATNLLTGDPLITFSIDDPASESYLTTPLKNSLFFRIGNDGQLESCRRSISAVLLVAVGVLSCGVVGILNPDAENPITASMLPKLPIVFLKAWPPEGPNVDIKWSNYNPSSNLGTAQFYY